MLQDSGHAAGLLDTQALTRAVEVSASPSRLLALKLRLASASVRASTLRFWEHPNLRQMFPHFMLDLYSIMRCSVPLMEAAEAEAKRLAPNDPVAAMLVPYLAHHQEEERPHADWHLDDLVVLGMDREKVAASSPSPLVANLIGAQYAWIFHGHPVALLGYMIQLEGNPPTRQHIEEIREVTGYPAEAFRCLLVHAENDPHHDADLNELLDAMPLTPAQNTLVAMSALHAAESIAALLDHLVDIHGATPAN